MSSMLKKTGGLSFKPKAARRPGATTSQPPSRGPTTEPAHTPAPTTESAPAQAPTEPARPPTKPQKPTNHGFTSESPVTTTQISTPAKATPAPPAELIPGPPPTPPATQQAPVERDAPSAKPATARAQEAASPPAEPVASVATPATSPAPVRRSIPQSSTLEKEPSPRHPLPQALTLSETSTASASKEAATGTASTAPPSQAAGLPSPAITAISRASVAPSGRALLSPSPFAVSDSITAIPPPEQLSTAGDATGAAPKKKRQYRRRKQPGEGEGAENGDGSTATAKPKRPRKRKAPAAEGQEDGTSAGNGTDPSAPKRHRRQLTPENLEGMTLEQCRPDHTTTKLGDLTKDLGIGKKFKHHDLILERQRQARHDAKMRKIEKQKRAMGLLPPEEATSAEVSRAGTPADTGDDGQATRVNRGQGMDFDIIDGQIVINQSSLVINQGAVDNTELETVEEDEFTHLTTSASYMRPSRQMGSNHWTEEETERFYHYLTMFGTDFETISHVFPGKNRRQVKLKFNREERMRPNRVNAAIMARTQKKVTIDLEDYKANRLGDGTWITPAKFHAESQALREEQEKELEVKRQERRDMGLLDDDPKDKKTGIEAVGADGQVVEKEIIEEIIEDDGAEGVMVTVGA